MLHMLLTELDQKLSCVIYVTTNVTHVTLQNEIGSCLVLSMLQQMLHMLPYRMRFGVLLCYLCYIKCYTCYLTE